MKKRITRASFFRVARALDGKTYRTFPNRFTSRSEALSFILDAVGQPERLVQLRRCVPPSTKAETHWLRFDEHKPTRWKYYEEVQ